LDKAPTKKKSGIKTIRIINRQVRIEARFTGIFLTRTLYTGRKRLVSRKERTKIDQKGQRIRPRKIMETRKTRRKYHILMEFGPFLCPPGAIS